MSKRKFLTAKDGTKVRIDPPTLYLSHLVVRGLVWWEEKEHQWLARASDGQVVQVGHDAQSAERYLAAHSTPEEW